MKVTEVRTARSCASWLSHYRSRAKPGPILSSSSFFSLQWRVAAKFPHPSKPNFSAMTRSTLASIALYSGSPAFTGLGRSAK